MSSFRGGQRSDGKTNPAPSGPLTFSEVGIGHEHNERLVLSEAQLDKMFIGPPLPSDEQAAQAQTADSPVPAKPAKMDWNVEQIEEEGRGIEEEGFSPGHGASRRDAHNVCKHTSMGDANLGAKDGTEMLSTGGSPSNMTITASEPPTSPRRESQDWKDAEQSSSQSSLVTNPPEIWRPNKMQPGEDDMSPEMHALLMTIRDASPAELSEAQQPSQAVAAGRLSVNTCSNSETSISSPLEQGQLVNAVASRRRHESTLGQSLRESISNTPDKDGASGSEQSAAQRATAMLGFAQKPSTTHSNASKQCEPCWFPIKCHTQLFVLLLSQQILSINRHDMHLVLDIGLNLYLLS